MQAVPIQFNSSSTQISVTQLDKIKQQASLCLEMAPAYLMVFTQGNLSNPQISYRRALSVKNQLIAFGIRPTRILLVSGRKDPSWLSTALGGAANECDKDATGAVVSDNYGYSVLLVKPLLA